MKTTKTEIQTVLRTLDVTAIFRIAKLNGVDISLRNNLFKFIKQYAPTKKVLNQAYNIAYLSKYKKYHNTSSLNQPVFNSIKFAKHQKTEGFTNYSKILIEGNNNIYWASPLFGHSDYNKSVAFEKNEKNLKVMNTINNFLNFKTL